MQKLLLTLFVRDYRAFTKTGTRHEHTKFSSLIHDTNLVKKYDAKKKAEEEADAKKKAEADAETATPRRRSWF